MISNARYEVGDAVEKCTGDYRIRGEVRGVFTMKNGAVRYAVEHAAAGGGSFLHVYAEGNLRPAPPLSPGVQSVAVEAAMAELDRQHEAPDAHSGLLWDTEDANRVGIDGRLDVVALVEAVLRASDCSS